MKNSPFILNIAKCRREIVYGIEVATEAAVVSGMVVVRKKC
jgi:hypothetical protein